MAQMGKSYTVLTKDRTEGQCTAKVHSIGALEKALSTRSIKQCFISYYTHSAERKPDNAVDRTDTLRGTTE